jgi:hypothetical protein
MATEVSFEPTTVNLTVYKGDSINLRFNLTENGGAYLIPANTNFLGGTIGTVTGSGPYTAPITAISSTAGMAVGQRIFATAGSPGTLGSGIVTIASVTNATSITVSSTATMTAGAITAINIGGWQGSIKKSSDSSFVGAVNLTGTSGNSYIEAYVPNTITANFIAGTAYRYDIQYTWVESGKAYLKTFVKGTITVLEDVTLASDA